MGVKFTDWVIEQQQIQFDRRVEEYRKKNPKATLEDAESFVENQIEEEKYSGH